MEYVKNAENDSYVNMLKGLEGRRNMTGSRIAIPTLLKVGKGTLKNLGKYLKDAGFEHVVMYFGNGLIEMFGNDVIEDVKKSGIDVIEYKELDTVKIEDIIELAFSIDAKNQVILGIGGGKVIDAAKYAAYLRKMPFISIPTSASSDGFSSASASLMVGGRRTSVPARMAYGIVVDTDIIKSAPEKFLYSGIGDMVSKITSLYDWQFESQNGYSSMNDFSVMIAKKAVNSFVRTPFEDIHEDLFLKELVDSLAMSGIANEIAGGSTPTSGSEHLISHALDKMLEHPQLHGIQVGIATYIMSRVQEHRYIRVNAIFEKTGFWSYVSTLNLNRKDFENAINMAPSIKPHRYTYLHEEKYRKKAIEVLYNDDVLKRVFDRGDYEAILFDLDGTMWNATEQIRNSWNIAIKEFKGMEHRDISDEELQSVMGKPMDEIAANLFGEYDKDMQLKILDRCCEIENEYLEEHGGILYPELEKTLAKLKENHKLCIVSNGQAGYIQAFLKAHNLSGYFDDIQNWGDNQVPKGENIKIVMKRNNISKAVYVGDTQGDKNSADMAGIDFIYARYGFGDVDDYTFAIDRFKQILEVV